MTLNYRDRCPTGQPPMSYLNTREELYRATTTNSHRLKILGQFTYAIYNEEEDLIEIYCRDSVLQHRYLAGVIYHEDNILKQFLEGLLGQSILIAVIDSNSILTVKNVEYISSYLSCTSIGYIYNTAYNYQLVYSVKIEYDLHLITANAIERTNICTYYPCTNSLPVIPISNETKLFIGTREDNYKYIRYIGGAIIYVTDSQALEELRFILLLICYLNSSVSTKYDLIVFSINHIKNKHSKDMPRVVGNRLTKRVKLLELDPGVHGLSEYTYEGRTILQRSKQMKELGRLLEIWLDRNRLYTEEKEVKVSNYIVDIRSINPLDIAKFLGNNPMRKIYDAKL